MLISACGKVCPKILAESSGYKEIEWRRASSRKYSLGGGGRVQAGVLHSTAEEWEKARLVLGFQASPGPKERQECMDRASKVP